MRFEGEEEKGTYLWDDDEGSGEPQPRRGPPWTPYLWAQQQYHQ